LTGGVSNEAAHEQDGRDADDGENEPRPDLPSQVHEPSLPIADERGLLLLQAHLLGLPQIPDVSHAAAAPLGSPYGSEAASVASALCNHAALEGENGDSTPIRGLSSDCCASAVSDPQLRQG